MKKIITSFILISICITPISLSYDSTSSYIWSTDMEPEQVSSSINSNTNSNSSNFASESSNNILNNKTIETNSQVEENNSLNLESGAAILIEQSTGQVLYSHNVHEQLRPASVTKVMSILLIMEQIDSGNLSYTDTISCSENASSMGGSQIWLDTRETLTVDEMLKAICVASANDCVVRNG